VFLTMMAVAAHVQFGSAIEEVGPGRNSTLHDALQHN
jgi:hypothetical protein